MAPSPACSAASPAARLAASVVLLLRAAAAYKPPKGYRLDDPRAAHGKVGRKLAEAGDLDVAIHSFKAACRFSNDASAYANLGVALMRKKDFAGSYRALMEGSKREPDSSHVKDNLEALYAFAGQHGVTTAEVQRSGERAELDVQGATESLAADEASGQGSAAGDAGSGGDKGEGEGGLETSLLGRARRLPNAKQIAKRGRELVKRGERRLGRGYMSLALHLNPWVARELPSWFAEAMKTEELLYWRGNLFVGNDKTYLESLASDHFVNMEEPDVHELALYTWRNLELTGMSCCGIDNVAVFLSTVRGWGHPYVVPFLHLTPEYVPRLKDENKGMYSSFKQWWESNGRRPMPEPSIRYLGGSAWEWPAMRVRLPAKRVQEGWDELVQAVLLLRLRHYEGARACAMQALRINGGLAGAVDELLPGLEELPFWQPVTHPAARRKYVICYNPFVGLGNVAVVMVSAHVLAQLTGRTLIVHWNINQVTRHAFRLKVQPDVYHVADGAQEMGVLTDSMKFIYLFHMMDSNALADMLELIGCSNPISALDAYQAVAVSSNLFFAPILRSNPHVDPKAVPDFSVLLGNLLEPSRQSVSRALSFANKTEFEKEVPVVAVHIRAREEGEDNDDWPTKDSPEEAMLATLGICLRAAVVRELGRNTSFDVFLAATTEKARTAAAAALKQKVSGLRRVLTLPNLNRNRRSSFGAVDAMAEALLISRSAVFVRMVVGTSGFSTFAFLSNALRFQTEWAASLPPLRTEGYMPNFLVTDRCSPESSCYRASPKVRMADVTWHGKAVVERSCGNVISRFQPSGKCETLEPLADAGFPSDEL